MKPSNYNSLLTQQFVALNSQELRLPPSFKNAIKRSLLLREAFGGGCRET